VTGSPLFEGIPSAELDAALSDVERRTVRAGAVLAVEGDYLAEMYVLGSGSAEIALEGDREPQVVARIVPGETIGEMSLLTHAPASATVRATEDAELLVLREEDLQALMERLPAVPRNIIRILSTRLTRMTRLAARDRPAEVVALANRGAPELLGYALASSVAWHTRLPTLHVVVADDPSPALEAFATGPFDPPIRRRRREGADLVVAHPRDGFEGDDLPRTLERLRTSFRYVLVEAAFWPEASDPVVDLAAPEHAALELNREEERAIAGGLLPPAGPASRALGGLARDLAQLKVGIALGSGSVRGYAHIGVLRRLGALGVPIDCLAGTSVGAIVGGLYAYFQDTERVADFLDELGARMFRPTLSRKSLLSTRAMRSYIQKVVGDGRIEDVPIPVAFVATDLDTHEEVVLRRGSGVTALFASSAVPGVFPAVSVGNRRLVDGGIVNPIPTSVAVQLGADVVIASRLVSGGGVDLDTVSEDGARPIPSAVSAIIRSIELVQTRMTASVGETPVVMITPAFDDLPAAKLRRFREGRRYIAAGEAAVDEALPRLEATLPWLRP
jgi:NTE family protein